MTKFYFIKTFSAFSSSKKQIIQSSAQRYFSTCFSSTDADIQYYNWKLVSDNYVKKVSGKTVDHSGQKAEVLCSSRMVSYSWYLPLSRLIFG